MSVQRDTSCSPTAEGRNIPLNIPSWRKQQAKDDDDDDGEEDGRQPHPEVVQGVAGVPRVVDEAVASIVSLRQWHAQLGVNVLHELSSVVHRLQPERERERNPYKHVVSLCCLSRHAGQSQVVFIKPKNESIFFKRPSSAAQVDSRDSKVLHGATVSARLSHRGNGE